MGWSEGGAEEGETGKVGVGDDVHEADLEAAEGPGKVDEADLHAADGAARSVARGGGVEDSKLEAVGGVGKVGEADLEAAEIGGGGPEGELESAKGGGIGNDARLETAQFCGDAQAGDLDAVEFGVIGSHANQRNVDATDGLVRPGLKVQADAREVVGVGEKPDVETGNGVIAGDGKVESESDDGGVDVDELKVVAVDADLQRRERGGRRRAREERQEKREEDGEEFLHGSAVSG